MLIMRNFAALWCLMFSLNATSNEYSWGDSDAFNYPTTLSACRHIVQKNTLYEGSQYILVPGSITTTPIYYPVTYPPYGKAVAGCRFSYRTSSEVNAGYDRVYTVDNYTALRYGDQCAVGKSYDYVMRGASSSRRKRCSLRARAGAPILR